MLSKEKISFNELFTEKEEGFVMGSEVELVSIDYKNNNMTIEFKQGKDVIGEATLKSHKTYDEIREITSGEDRILIWYEFSNFSEIQKDALKEVIFIDMREEIANDTLLKEGGFIEKDINILNPNYLKPIQKNYTFVYMDEKGNWVDYNSKDIPSEKIIIGVKADLGWGEYLDVVFNVFNNELDRHALVFGTSAGFVTTAPTADPEGTNTVVDYSSYALRATSPANAIKITEIGWWCDTASEAANFEVGIYSDDATFYPNTVVGSLSQTNAKGTTAGWKKATGLNIEISGNTIYWIAIQLDNTATTTYINYASDSGKTYARTDYQSSLVDPWFDDGFSLNSIVAIYAVWEAGAPPSSCASLSGNTWYVPAGCQCYCDSLADGQLNLSKCSCINV